MATSNLQAATLRVRDLVLSSEVYSTDKVREFIDGVYAVKYSTDVTGKFINEKKALTPLSVITVTEDQYKSITDASEPLSDAFYLVETSCLNAYGSRLTDVGDPVDDDDAVNVRYLKKHVNSVFGEYVKAADYDVNEFINQQASSHTQMHFTNTEAIKMLGDDNSNGVVYTEISCPAVSHQLSSIRALKLDEIALLSRTSGAINDSDKAACRMVIADADGNEITSSNEVSQESTFEILRFRFNGEVIDPCTCLSASFRTSNGQQASKGLSFFNRIDGVKSKTSTGIQIDKKMPVVVSISGIPVQVAKGIVMKDNEGNVRYLTIENGTISITRVDDI